MSGKEDMKEEYIKGGSRWERKEYMKRWKGTYERGGGGWHV